MKFKKILITDDSSTARMLIRNYLQIAGLDDAEFYEANDGSEALSLLDSSPVDLIITDVIMPKIDGNVFIKKLRLRPNLKNIPVVVLTSMGEEGVHIDPDDRKIKIIQKPVSPEKLISVLEDLDE